MASSVKVRTVPGRFALLGGAEGFTTNPDRVFGSRMFTDGVDRPIYEGAAGRQDVLGSKADRVSGGKTCRSAAPPL
jgi:hypothetical protein